MLTDKIVDRITQNKIANGAFVYHKGSLQGSGEATAWAMLAFQKKHIALDDKTVEWFLSLQLPGGEVRISKAVDDLPIWLTPLFSYVVKKIGKLKAGKKAIDFLLKFKPETYANTKALKQNNSLMGLSWTKGAFSWVEPTAWMLISLKEYSYENHPRALEAVSVLKDRFIPNKGWNYGNKNVYSSDLLPFYDTTAIALLALNGMSNVDDYSLIIDSMSQTVLKSSSPYSLALQIILMKKCKLDVTKQVVVLEELLNNEEVFDYCNTVHLSMALVAFTEGIDF